MFHTTRPVNAARTENQLQYFQTPGLVSATHPLPSVNTVDFTEPKESIIYLCVDYGSVFTAEQLLSTAADTHCILARRHPFTNR